MVVENESRTVSMPQPECYGPEDVGRVAGLKHRELPLPTCTEDQEKSREKRIRVLHDETESPASRRIGAILQQRDALKDLVSGIFLPFWADDGHVVTRSVQGLALQPDATIERDWQILDDNEDPRSGIRLGQGGHTAHPIPS